MNVIVAGLATVLHGTLFSVKVSLTPIPFTLIGLALEIFLGFLNNVAYDRYWEARKLWGEVAYASRSLARQCQSLIVDSKPVDPRNLREDVRVRMIYRAIAFAHVLRLRLRHLDQQGAEVKSLLRDEEWRQLGHSANGPVFLLQMMGSDLKECMSEGCLDACLAAVIDQTLSPMTAAAAGCERIGTTPIPFSYTLLLHRTAYLYCFLLPFGLVDTLGFMTPFVVLIVAYTFFGLDALGDQIEEPFGVQANDLPLDAICRTIEIDLRDSAHDEHVLQPLAPVKYCLL